ncbi:MAG: AraC family transcriptional regulator, partial [Pseudomonadota bacterium]
VDKDIMAPVIREELHYRALKAHHGLMIRYLLSMGNHRGKITRAIEYLRRNYRDAATIDQLAKIAGMGLTSFHTHFREVTRTTPKQFQKELRLIEARRLLVEECLPVATVAYEVGYKSPKQGVLETLR